MFSRRIERAQWHEMDYRLSHKSVFVVFLNFLHETEILLLWKFNGALSWKKVQKWLNRELFAWYNVSQRPHHLEPEGKFWVLGFPDGRKMHFSVLFHGHIIVPKHPHFQYYVPWNIHSPASLKKPAQMFVLSNGTALNSIFYRRGATQGVMCHLIKT